jgi:septal ring factor EnvC (AmiA/AmiB activator)
MPNSARRFAGVTCLAVLAQLPGTFPITSPRAQDVLGIEVCTRESKLDRRTGCLQSNIEYLQQLVTKNALDSQQKLNSANRDIAALKEQLAAASRDLASLKDALAAAKAKLDQLSGAQKSDDKGRTK